MKKKNYYLRALIIYIVILAVILGAALWVLNRFLVSYEASRPDNVMESYMESHDRQHFLGGIRELIGEGFNEFTLTTAAPSEFGIDEQGDITWRSAGGSDESKSYEVRMGKTKVCTVSLVPGEDVGFGMNSWVVSGEEYHMPGGTDLTVSVPTGCTATVNGIAVSGSYADSVGTVGVELAHSFDKAPDSDIYVIKNMMGPVEVTAYDAYGTELKAVFTSENEIEFHPEPTAGFSFYTLPGAEVSINGSIIGEEYSTTIGGELGIELLRYECEGLYAEPQISVLWEGKSFSPARLGIGSCFIPDASPVISGELADFVEKFIYAYVDFTADKNDSAEANFVALAQYLLPESELYTLTANSIENISWATTSGLKYNSIDYYDLIPLGEDRYICDIYYDISYTLGSRNLDIKTTNTVLIEQVEGQYYVAAMGAEL